MGTRRTGFTSVGGGSSSRGTAGVLKDRANMSFMLVVMFFAVFGLIVLTEIFLIDERRTNGGPGALGGHRNGHRMAAPPDRPDYEEVAVIEKEIDKTPELTNSCATASTNIESSKKFQKCTKTF